MDDVGARLIEHHARDATGGSTKPGGTYGAVRGRGARERGIQAESDVRCPKPGAYLQNAATGARVEIHRFGHAPRHDSTGESSEGE